MLCDFKAEELLGQSMRRWISFFLASSAIISTSCSSLNTANRNTIDRTTTFPSQTPLADGETDSIASVVHLDIQQRLFIATKAGKFCAEPSPDALAAYAAAIGISASNPASAAGSLALSASSNAASVGLRTQTITVMRDAMYRVCEAYANELVGVAQVPTLFGRSQDLTAVILAVEQLTGPLSAQQVALSTTSDADASASLVAVAKQLELATAAVERAEARLEESSAEVTSLENKIKPMDEAIISKTSQKDQVVLAAGGTPTPAQQIQIDTLQSEIDTLKQDKGVYDNKKAVAVKSVELRKESLTSAKETRDTIKEKQDTAFASASAGTTGSSRFAGSSSTTTLSKDAGVAIAEAVENIVTTVLEKSYIEESCLSVMTLTNSPLAATDPLLIACVDLVKATVGERTAKAKLETAIITGKTRQQTVLVLDELMSCLSTPGDGINTAKRNALLAQAQINGLRSGVVSVLQGHSTATNLETALAGNSTAFGKIIEANSTLGTCS